MNQLLDKPSGTQNQTLAKLHVECLPHTAVSHLGERYAARFYDYVALSPTDHAFILRGVGYGDIQAACIVSLEPASLIRRLWRHTPLLYAVVTHLTNPAIIGVARALSPWKPGRQTPAHDDAPEVTSIFTAPDRLRCGLGTRLLARCEDFPQLTSNQTPRRVSSRASASLKLKP